MACHDKRGPTRKLRKDGGIKQYCDFFSFFKIWFHITVQYFSGESNRAGQNMREKTEWNKQQHENTNECIASLLLAPRRLWVKMTE